jgi:hypothetical protein
MELFGTALTCLELVDTVTVYMYVDAALLNLEVKMTFTVKVTLLVFDVATKSKYLIPTSFSLVERTCN